jgi:hypothetical protein
VGEDSTVTELRDDIRATEACKIVAPPKASRGVRCTEPNQRQ